MLVYEAQAIARAHAAGQLEGCRSATTETAHLRRVGLRTTLCGVASARNAGAGTDCKSCQRKLANALAAA